MFNSDFMRKFNNTYILAFGYYRDLLEYIMLDNEDGVKEIIEKIKNTDERGLISPLMGEIKKELKKRYPFYDIGAQEEFLFSSINIDRVIEAIKKFNVIDSTESMTPLMHACRKENINIVKSLIDAGADVNAYDMMVGLTPLMFTSNIDIAKLLINAGADVNYSNGFMTPLMLACDNENYEMAKLLIDAGADVNYKNMRNLTALMISVEKKQQDIIKLLVDKGADVNIKTLDGFSPLEYAKKNNLTKIIKILKKAV